MNKSKQLFTLITSEGELQVSLKEVDVPEPKPHEVIVRMEASPINPSDMWPMFGPASLDKATFDADKRALVAPVHKPLLSRIKSRLDQTLPIGNEGAGTVVKAGDSPEAQALIGKTVSILTGAAYTEYACVPMQACLPHLDSTTPQQAASSFVNPLTALGMVETMRMEGHKALVPTAAASNLGQMLNKICLEEGVELVNIVRSQEQVDLLKGIGAKIVLDSSSENFKAELYQAIDTTGATILTMMEASGSKDAKGFNTYGSDSNKQVYIYGGLDFSPTILNRAYGMTWSIGGWLLMRFLGKLDKKRVVELYQKVAMEINTTFASSYTKELSLEEALQPENVALYNAKKTGEKYLIVPNKG